MENIIVTALCIGLSTFTAIFSVSTELLEFFGAFTISFIFWFCFLFPLTGNYKPQKSEHLPCKM